MDPAGDAYEMYKREVSVLVLHGRRRQGAMLHKSVRRHAQSLLEAWYCMKTKLVLRQQPIQMMRTLALGSLTSLLFPCCSSAGALAATGPPWGSSSMQVSDPARSMNEAQLGSHAMHGRHLGPAPSP